MMKRIKTVALIAGAACIAILSLITIGAGLAFRFYAEINALKDLGVF